MERVNLLPEEARLTFPERVLLTVERDFPKVLAMVVGGVVAAGVLVSVLQWATLSRNERKLKALKKEVEILKVEGANMESFLKQLDQVGQELSRQKKTIEWKISYLKETKERPKVWAVLLKDLRQNIPHGVWLTELETGTSRALRITGGAPDEDLVTQFMTNLKASPYFTNVGFSYAEKDAIGNIPIVKFEIVCQVG